jgi:hypothetical protein
MPAPKLTDLGRRVLGHLPAWASDEPTLIEAEGGVHVSIRGYDLATFTTRLAEDQSIDPPLNEDGVLSTLEALKQNGLASDSSGKWKMLKLGFAALTDEAENEAQSPGAVVVELNPAVGIAEL